MLYVCIAKFKIRRGKVVFYALPSFLKIFLHLLFELTIINTATFCVAYQLKKVVTFTTDVLTTLSFSVCQHLYLDNVEFMKTQYNVL